MKLPSNWVGYPREREKGGSYAEEKEIVCEQASKRGSKERKSRRNVGERVNSRDELNARELTRATESSVVTV